MTRPIRGLTIFMPVLDEEEILVENVLRVLRHAETLGRDVQLVVVDNGSTDRTPALLEILALDEPRLVPLRIPEPGVGAALRAALPVVEHEAILALDADLSVDLSFIDDAVRELDAGADLVVGAKITGVERRPPFRRLVSRVFSWTVTHGLGLPVHDASIGAKAYRTGVLRDNVDVIGRGSTYVLSLLVRAQADGLSVREIPTRCDDQRESRFNLLHEGILRFGHLAALVARRRLGVAPRTASPPRPTPSPGRAVLLAGTNGAASPRPIDLPRRRGGTSAAKRSA